MKAIILDDDPLVLTLLNHILHRRGYEVMTYDNPTAYSDCERETCQGLIQRACPDVIISDFDMPLVNGLEFFEALCRKGCRCRHMAMISGSIPDQALLERLKELGIKFFAKPVHREHIIDWLRQAEPRAADGSPARRPSAVGVREPCAIRVTL
jgi:CheY-like chemotaxis protein